MHLFWGGTDVNIHTCILSVQDELRNETFSAPHLLNEHDYKDLTHDANRGKAERLEMKVIRGPRRWL